MIGTLCCRLSFLWDVKLSYLLTKRLSGVQASFSTWLSQPANYSLPPHLSWSVVIILAQNGRSASLSWVICIGGGWVSFPLHCEVLWDHDHEVKRDKYVPSVIHHFHVTSNETSLKQVLTFNLRMTVLTDLSGEDNILEYKIQIRFFMYAQDCAYILFIKTSPAHAGSQ